MIKFSRSPFNRHWNYFQILNLCLINWKAISVFKIFRFYCLYLNFKSLTDRCQTLNNNFRFSMFYFRFSIFDCWMIVDVAFWKLLRQWKSFKIKPMLIFCLDINSELQIQSLQQRILFKDMFQRDFQLKSINISRLRLQCQRVKCKFYDQHINI